MYILMPHLQVCVTRKRVYFLYMTLCFDSHHEINIILLRELGIIVYIFLKNESTFVYHVMLVVLRENCVEIN